MKGGKRMKYDPVALLERNKEMVVEKIKDLEEHLNHLEERKTKTKEELAAAKKGKIEIEKAIDDLKK